MTLKLHLAAESVDFDLTCIVCLDKHREPLFGSDANCSREFTAQQLCPEPDHPELLRLELRKCGSSLESSLHCPVLIRGVIEKGEELEHAASFVGGGGKFGLIE